MTSSGPNPREWPAEPMDPRPERDPTWWPDFTLPRLPAPFPLPPHPKYHLPYPPGSEVWDDPYWYA